MSRFITKISDREMHFSKNGTRTRILYDAGTVYFILFTWVFTHKKIAMNILQTFFGE